MKQILMHLIYDCRPLDTVEKKCFISLIQFLEPNFVLPSRKTICDTIISVFESLCENIIVDIKLNMLAEKKSYSLQFDHWSFLLQEKFISISLAYVNTDYQIKTINLGNFPCKGETAKNISADLKQIMKRYHLIVEVIYQYLYFEQRKDEMIDENGNDDRDIEIFYTSDAFSANKAAIKSQKQNSIICFIHTCNNVLKGLLDFKTSALIINKIKEINKVFKNSHKLKQELKSIFTKINPHLNFTSPKLDQETRFNSIYKMISSFIVNLPSIQQFIQKENEVNEIIVFNLLSPEDQQVTEGILQITLQFEMIFLELQKRDIPTLSLILPYHYQICEKILISNPNISENKKLIQIKSYLLDIYKLKFKNQYGSSILTLGKATFLNPIYKSLIKTKDLNLNEEIINSIKEEIQLFKEKNSSKLDENDLIYSLKKNVIK